MGGFCFGNLRLERSLAQFALIAGTLVYSDHGIADRNPDEGGATGR